MKEWRTRPIRSGLAFREALERACLSGRGHPVEAAGLHPAERAALPEAQPPRPGAGGLHLVRAVLRLAAAAGPQVAVAGHPAGAA